MTSTYPLTTPTIDSQPPPSHHIHSSSDRLPTPGGATNKGPSPFDTIAQPPTANQTTSVDSASTHSTLDGEQSASDPNFDPSKVGLNNGPLDTKPVPAGGVVRNADERLGNNGTGEELPEGKAGLMDKFIGKAEKVSVTTFEDIHIAEMFA